MKYVKGRRSYSMTINNNTTPIIVLIQFKLFVYRLLLYRHEMYLQYYA